MFFANPILLLGLAAAALPVLIHLLLRPRPVPARFPAVTLLRKVVRSGRQASRVRNTALLLTRAGMLALLALLVARPTCRPTAGAFVEGEPIACAVVLDHSGSMTYTIDQRTTFADEAQRWVSELLRTSRTWPADSAIALFSTNPDAPTASLDTEARPFREALSAIGQTEFTAQTLRTALRQAVETLRGAAQPARRLIVVTDLAASAWRDVTLSGLESMPDLQVTLVTPHSAPRTNLALTSFTTAERGHPSNAPLPVNVTAAAAGMAGTCWVSIHAGARELARAGPLEIAADRATSVELAVPPMSPGLHPLTARLAPADRLDFDQTRYVAAQVVSPPEVWLVGPAQGNEDLSALLLRNLLAPSSLPAEAQRLTLRALSAAEVSVQLAETDARDRPALLIVLSGSGLPAQDVARLLRLVSAGTTLLLAPSAGDGSPDWPNLRSQIASDVPRREDLAAPQLIRWMPSAAAALPAEALDLGRAPVQRRVRVTGTLSEVTVAATYRDDVPAILVRPRQAGRIVLLTTAPDPSWSGLGVRAAGLLTWLHTLVDESAAVQVRTDQFVVGEPTRRRFAGLPASGLVQVTQLAAKTTPTVWRRLEDHQPTEPWPTKVAGAYIITPPSAGEPFAAYAVNWPAEESQLARMTPAALSDRLGTDEIRMLETDSIGPFRGTGEGALSHTRMLRSAFAGGLLLLFLAELLLVARHHQRGASVTSSE